jgi:hypothetical protein
METKKYNSNQRTKCKKTFFYSILKTLLAAAEFAENTTENPFKIHPLNYSNYF